MSMEDKIVSAKLLRTADKIMDRFKVHAKPYIEFTIHLARDFARTQNYPPSLLEKFNEYAEILNDKTYYPSSGRRPYPASYIFANDNGTIKLTRDLGTIAEIAYVNSEAVKRDIENARNLVDTESHDLVKRAEVTKPNLWNRKNIEVTYSYIPDIKLVVEFGQSLDTPLVPVVYSDINETIAVEMVRRGYRVTKMRPDLMIESQTPEGYENRHVRAQQMHRHFTIKKVGNDSPNMAN